MGRRKISDLFDSEMGTKQLNREHYGLKIKKYRVRKGLSAEDLARALRISLSTVRNWEAGISRPDLALLSHIFILLDVDPNEFFGLEGVGHALSEDEDRVISFYRAMDARARDDYVAVGGALAARSHALKLKEVRNSVIPLFRVGSAASAGVGDGWCDEEGEEVLVSANPLTKKADLIIPVSGDSMEPDYHDGDQVLVRRCSEMRLGDVYIWSVPGLGLMIKEAGADRLISRNQDYADIIPWEEDGARLVGRVLGVLTPDMIPGENDQALYWEAMALQKEESENDLHL